MFIKLQADQVFLFWDLIKDGIIRSYRIPMDHRQNFSVKYLEHLLTGMCQAWVSYEIDEEGNKKVIAIVCTRIIREESYGVQTLFVDALYGFRLITQGVIDEAIGVMEKYAIANDCSVILTEYTLPRVGDILSSMGFEDHRTISRKVLTK